MLLDVCGNWYIMWLIESSIYLFLLFYFCNNVKVCTVIYHTFYINLFIKKQKKYCPKRNKQYTIFHFLGFFFSMQAQLLLRYVVDQSSLVLACFPYILHDTKSKNAMALEFSSHFSCLYSSLLILSIACMPGLGEKTTAIGMNRRALSIFRIPAALVVHHGAGPVRGALPDCCIKCLIVQS